jgi:hypothetical protein
MTAFGWLASFSLFAASANVITFDHDSLGKTPPGWILAMTTVGQASRPVDRLVPPRWEIVRDLSAPTPPYVLAQVSPGPREDRLPLAVWDRVSVRDGDLSVRLKPVSGRHDLAGGLLFRYRDERNYYAVRASATGDEVSLYKVENGRTTPISPRGMPPSSFEVKHDIRPNAWQILKISFRGNQFQVYVNHRLLFRAQDATFTGPGKVGVFTVSDSVTYFDDFRVYPK